MAASRLSTRHLREVAWRDLVPISRREGLRECLLPFPWLGASWIAAAGEIWPVALACAFMFFLVALRLNHDAIHHNLGFASRGHHLVMHALGIVMMGSNHSVAFNHLRHHKYLDTPQDIEGKCGHMGLFRVLAYGPRFPIECHLETWRQGGRVWRRRMAIDLALNCVLPVTALVLALDFLWFHFAAMLVAQSLTALFAVWITHRRGNGHIMVARTQRNAMVNLVSYNMFFHLEHHLFPAVPTKRLPELARRLDEAAPELARGAGRVLG